MVDLDGVVLVYYPPVVEVFVDLVLSDGMLDVVVLDLLGPAVVEVVDLAGYFSAALQVERLVHLRVSALSQDAQYEVAVLEDGKLIP